MSSRTFRTETLPDTPEAHFSDQISNRFLFLGEIVVTLILNYILYLLFRSLGTFLTISEASKLIYQWGSYAVATVLACNIGYWLNVKIFHSSDNNYQKVSGTDAFRTKTLSFGKQVEIFLILLCVVYVPLDLLFYLIPGVLQYSISSLTDNSAGNYFYWEWATMIPITFAIHFCVAFREEYYFRHYVISQGQKELGMSTAWFYSAMTFSLGHFAYIFAPSTLGYSNFYPIIWGFSALLIGSIAGFVFSRTKTIWPVICAHWLNNVISASVLKRYMEGTPFSENWTFPYGPIIILGFICVLLFRKDISAMMNQFIPFIRQYRAENSPTVENVKVISISEPATIKKKKGISNEKLLEETTVKPQIRLISGKDVIVYLVVDLFLFIIIWILNLFLF
jgi:membrane protease YdiL (CAAX protease family)